MHCTLTPLRQEWLLCLWRACLLHTTDGGGVEVWIKIANELTNLRRYRMVREKQTLQSSAGQCVDVDQEMSEEGKEWRRVRKEDMRG